MPKNLTLALSAILLSSYAFAASAVIVQTPPKRSAMQEECIKENPKDHKGYLSCIHAKREEKKSGSTDSKGNVIVPASAPVSDPNQPAVKPVVNPAPSNR